MQPVIMCTPCSIMTSCVQEEWSEGGGLHAPVFKKSGVREVVCMHLCSRRVE